MSERDIKRMRDIALSGGKCNRTHPDKRRRRNLMARVRRIRKEIEHGST